MTCTVHANGLCHIAEGVYPAIGFGTYPLKDETCFTAVTQAAKLGYRIIDTATFYGNFDPIGKALQAFERHNFYIISKVWPDAHTPQKIQEDITTTLKHLHTNYLDAYLLHWPNSTVPIEKTLLAMEGLRTRGIIRHIGLSNVTTNHLQRALEVGVPLAWVQVEMHPLFYDDTLLEFCHKNSITVQAWAPLARGRISKDTILTEIGQKYGKTASQIALRWIIQHGCIPLPGSTNVHHMQENLASADFTLSQEEMHTIDTTARNGKRQRISAEKGMGFTDEFDFSYEECWPKS